MSESFAELFEASLSEIDMNPGAIVAGTVIDIDSDWVTVHAGLKSEGVIAKSEFLDEQGNFALEIGHIVKVALETVEDGFGATKLSREKAKRAESWMELEAAYEKNDIVTGVINGKVKAAIQRTAAPGEFRANIHQGGSASVVRPSPEERRLAIKAAKAMGLAVAGVDLIRSKTGPLLLEVNSSPGLEGIESATEKDVAGMMIAAIEHQLKWDPNAA